MLTLMNAHVWSHHIKRVRTRKLPGRETGSDRHTDLLKSICVSAIITEEVDFCQSTDPLGNVSSLRVEKEEGETRRSLCPCPSR
jgi:hypothetical protein